MGFSGRLATMCVVACALANVTLMADVIPTQYRSDSPAEGVVVERMVASGVSEADAAARVARLTEDQVEYFAADSARIQYVGQGRESGLFWYEWVFGLASLAGAVGFLYIFAIGND